MCINTEVHRCTLSVVRLTTADMAGVTPDILRLAASELSTTPLPTCSQGNGALNTWTFAFRDQSNQAPFFFPLVTALLPFSPNLSVCIFLTKQHLRAPPPSLHLPTHCSWVFPDLCSLSLSHSLLFIPFSILFFILSLIFVSIYTPSPFNL